MRCLGSIESVCRSPFRRGAWIETPLEYPIALWTVVALLFGGERGLKLYLRNPWQSCEVVALLFGGERGLKPVASGCVLASLPVALLFGGERGLKPFLAAFPLFRFGSLSFSEGSVD